MPIDPSTAFVSYSREDLEFVLRLTKDLKAKGAKVWMDKLDIRPGQRWEMEVETALNKCSRMMVILSPTSVASSNVLAEAAFAIDEGKEVIPVLYCECKVPFRLRPFQYADFRSNYSSGIEDLLASLNNDKESTASAPARPQESVQMVSDGEKKRGELRWLSESEERERVATTEKTRLEHQEHERQAAAEQVRLEQKERERQAAEQARLEEERSLAAAQKARLEQERRERKAAAEKACAAQEKRERQTDFGRADREQEERKKAAERVNEQPACTMTEDQLDETWEAERKKRENELTKAVVDEWSSHGSVHRSIEETELLKTLRAALSEWLSKRPPGFENRQIKRQEQQQAETRRAIDSWRKRTEE